MEVHHRGLQRTLQDSALSDFFPFLAVPYLCYLEANHLHLRSTHAIPLAPMLIHLRRFVIHHRRLHQVLSTLVLILLQLCQALFLSEVNLRRHQDIDAPVMLHQTPIPTAMRLHREVE
jgi:hypothetical protein